MTATHSDYLWVIDPLDGTENYVQGLPIFAISIIAGNESICRSINEEIKKIDSL